MATLEEVEMVKDYLYLLGYKSTAECFEKENNYLSIEKKTIKETPILDPNGKHSKFTAYLQSIKGKSKQLERLQDAYRSLERKYKGLLQCSRQIFSIAINCVQFLQDIKDKKQPDTSANLTETIQSYRIQIGKYHRIIMSDEWDEKTIIINKAIIQEHKKKLNEYKSNNNTEKIIEVLLSLRVNALQISPELRRDFVNELIKDDIFNIVQLKSNSFVIELLNIHAYNLRHAALSLISITATVIDGADYLLMHNTSIIEKVIEIMKSQEDGTVIQRFCIAIIQKVSLKKDCIAVYIKHGIIDWIIKLIQRYQADKEKIHPFCIDFSTALIANVLHSEVIQEFLENNIAACKNLTETFLSILKEKNIPNSVIMHILISLSYMNKDRFNMIKDECRLVDRISEFVDYYKNAPMQDNEASTETEKQNILDLCDYIFTKKIDYGDGNQSSLSSANKDEQYENRLKEIRNDRSDIKFECFQDEIS